MKTKLSNLVSILILAAFVLTPAWTLGTRETFQAVLQAEIATPTQATTTRVSVASDGSQGNSGSGSPSISADGRFVAFHSGSSNLVAGDTNNFCNNVEDNCCDVFVHDRQTGNTELVSVASDGSQGNNHSWYPSISADGRYVAFKSLANNLVIGDTNNFCGWGSGNCQDIFVHDRQTGITERVSVASDGTEGNEASEDFYSPYISANGRFVAFDSLASNLVSGDTNNFCGTGEDNCTDVFVHDRQTGTTERVSVASDGSQGNNQSQDPSISADGRYVTFTSAASNLVAGDTYGDDVFLHDRQTGDTERVSVASDGSQGNHGSLDSTISADGRYVAFRSWASNLVSGDTNNEEDIFIHDRQTGVTERVSVASDGTQGNFSSWLPSISTDGRYVAFSSFASNLVIGDTNIGCWGGDRNCEDIFVHDRQTRITTRVSVASDGSQGDSFSRYPSISASGRYVAFDSWASNLVYGDTNGYGDIFMHDRGEQKIGVSLYIPVTLNKP